MAAATTFMRMGRQLRLRLAAGLVLLLLHAATGAAKTLKPGYQSSKAPKTKPPTTSLTSAWSTPLVWWADPCPK